MLKKLLLTVFVICGFSEGFSQPLGGKYYSATPGGNSFTYPIIQCFYDGNIMGTDVGSVFTSFSIFKTDPVGSVLWVKNIQSSVAFKQPIDNTILSDSTMAIVMETDNGVPGSGIIVVKCDLLGNILWAFQYTPQAAFSFLPIGIDPAPDGGMVIAMWQQLLFINADGTIKDAFSIVQQSFFEKIIWDVLYMDNGKYKVFGSIVNSGSLFLFDIDSAGVTSNPFSYNMVNYTLGTGYWNPSTMITRMKSGGAAYILPLDSQSDYFGVFAFDSLNDPLWAKRILLSDDPRNIVATKDSGCIVTSRVNNNGSSALHTLPRISKFDSAGNIEWMKVPGDIYNNLYSYDGIASMVPDTGSGFYCAVENDNLFLFHTDSAFNGFCNYSYTPYLTSPLTVTVDSLDVIVSPFLLAESPVNVTATNAIWYEYDACQSVGINNDQHPSVAIKVFPDPASDEIQIVLPESLRKGRLMIKSNLGNTVLESDFTGNSKVLDVGNFRNGIYHIQVMDEMNVFSKKFMVVH